MSLSNTKSSQQQKPGQMAISWGNDSKTHPRALGNNKNTVYRSTFRGGTAFTTRRMHHWESTDTTTSSKNSTQEIGLNMALQMNPSTSIASPINTDTSTNLNIKTQLPMIELYVAIEEEAEVKQASSNIAPEYDHFQPMLAHFSTTKDTEMMAECLVETLQLLVIEGCIDFFEESKFVFAGRAFGEYGDCEYRISIFRCNDVENCRSVIEIRRSCGEAFTFANAESRILKILRAKEAIPQFESSFSNVNSASEVDTPFTSFTFGQLPDYSTLEWPSELPHYDIGYSESESVVDDEQSVSVKQVITITTHLLSDNSNNNLTVMDTSVVVNAEQCLKCAVVSDTVQEEWRFDVAELKHEIERNVQLFVSIAGIVQTLLNSINDEKNFDAFVTRTILQCINLLMDGNVKLPVGFEESVGKIQMRWKMVVENHISPNVSFKFAPSQQVFSECEVILKKYSNQ